MTRAAQSEAFSSPFYSLYDTKRCNPPIGLPLILEVNHKVTSPSLNGSTGRM